MKRWREKPSQIDDTNTLILCEFQVRIASARMIHDKHADSVEGTKNVLSKVPDVA